jgi:hypothetical protein
LAETCQYVASHPKIKSTYWWFADNKGKYNEICGFYGSEYQFTETNARIVTWSMLPSVSFPTKLHISGCLRPVSDLPWSPAQGCCREFQTHYHITCNWTGFHDTCVAEGVGANPVFLAQLVDIFGLFRLFL